MDYQCFSQNVLPFFEMNLCRNGNQPTEGSPAQTDFLKGSFQKVGSVCFCTHCGAP